MGYKCTKVKVEEEEGIRGVWNYILTFKVLKRLKEMLKIMFY